MLLYNVYASSPLFACGRIKNDLVEKRVVGLDKFLDIFLKYGNIIIICAQHSLNCSYLMLKLSTDQHNSTISLAEQERFLNGSRKNVF